MTLCGQAASPSKAHLANRLRVIYCGALQMAFANFETLILSQVLDFIHFTRHLFDNCVKMWFAAERGVDD